MAWREVSPRRSSPPQTGSCPEPPPVAPISLMVELRQRFLDQSGELGTPWSLVAGLVELGDRLCRLTLLFQDGAEVIMGPGDVGFDSDRRAECADHLLELCLLLQGEAEVSRSGDIIS